MEECTSSNGKWQFNLYFVKFSGNCFNFVGLERVSNDTVNGLNSRVIIISR